MDQKTLTENGWKAIAQKFKVKDNGLQRALATYEKIEDEKHDARLKAVASVSQFAVALGKNEEVASLDPVVEYLDDVVSAADLEKRDLLKAKALAEKTAKAAAITEAEEKKQEEEEGDYAARLLAALQKLKSSKELSYEFLVCDAKPHCGLVVAKKITTKHKEELTRLTDGSKRFLPPGSCRFEEGKFTFSMDRPVSGLARKLQDSIMYFTSKKFPILVGAESADEDVG